MSKRQFHFAVVSKLTLEYEKGAPTSSAKTADLRLEVSGNLSKAEYIDGKGLPRKKALKPITSTLVSALITNVRMGAEKGWWKEGEHMEYIIDLLQKMHIHPGSSTFESTMEY